MPNCGRVLSVDASMASLAPEVWARSPKNGLLHLRDEKPSRLQVFIDRSTVEVFSNDRQCLTSRAHPSSENSSGISLLARRTNVQLISLRGWQKRSIWPELKSWEGDE